MFRSGIPERLEALLFRAHRLYEMVDPDRTDQNVKLHFVLPSCMDRNQKGQSSWQDTYNLT